MSKSLPIVLTVLLLALGPLLAAPACSETAVPIPPKAQTAMNRGLAAAKHHDWDLAIKYFAEANKIAPDNPAAMYNLALAYDLAGGRNILALIWFHAFLDAEPKAPNALEVRKRITDLGIEVEGTIQKVANMSKRAILALPLKAFKHFPLDDASDERMSKSIQAVDVALALAYAKRAEDALSFAASLTGKYRAEAYGAIADAQAANGDVCEGYVTLRRIAQKWLSDDQIQADVKGLRQTAIEEERDAGLNDIDAVEVRDAKPLQFSCTHAPFNDGRVRRAFQWVANHVQTGTPPTSRSFARARKLLAAAGFSSGNNFPHVTLLYDGVEFQKRDAASLKGPLVRDLGIQVELVRKPIMPATKAEDWADIARQLQKSASDAEIRVQKADAGKNPFFWGSFGLVAPVDMHRFLGYIKHRPVAQAEREEMSAAVQMAATLHKIRKNAQLKRLREAR